MSFLFLRETFAPTLLEQRARRLREETGNPRLRSKLDTQGTLKDKLQRAAIRPIMILVATPIVTLCSLYIAIAYGILYLLIATFTYVFTDQYGFDEGSSGLSFLPAGIGMVIGVLGFGQLTDLMVKRTKAKGLEHKPEDRLNPLMTIPCGLAMPAGLFIYGWTAEKGIHWIVPMLGVLIMCTGLMGIMVSIHSNTWN
jgi:hypothetical protein